METLESWREYAQTHSLYDLLWKIYQDRHYYDYVGALPNGSPTAGQSLCLDPAGK